MQNAAHNGFGCPYCRTAMAKKEEDYDDDSSTDDSSIEYDTIIYEGVGQSYSRDALTSFRMFTQRINGEEAEEPVEVEVEEDDESDLDDDESILSDEEEDNIPSSSYVVEKLLDRGITYEDLVKHILFQAHSTWNRFNVEQGRCSRRVDGHFRGIIRYYQANLPTTPVPNLSLQDLVIQDPSYTRPIYTRPIYTRPQL
jgi:hypothetical protein